MAAAGEQAEHILEETVKKNKGKYICIAEGAIPTKDNGVYGKIHGKTMMEIANNVCKNAAAVICVGNCACYGGLPAAKPNPTEAKSVQEVTGVKTVNLAGCPPNADNMVATIVHYLLLGKLPALDDKGRPLFAYGQLIHDNCERRGHFRSRRVREGIRRRRGRQRLVPPQGGLPRVPRHTTIAPRSGGTRGPTGLSARVIRALGAANRTSGTK